MQYKNPPRPKAVVDAWNRERYERGSAVIAEYKATHPCVKCGETDPICLDFHHLENKELQITKARRLTPETLQREFAKCVMLCANCHRKLHAGSIAL